MRYPTDILDERFVRVGKGWTAQMREMADHIGAHKTLLISYVFGGQQIYVAANPERNRLCALVDEKTAKILSHVYRCERLSIQTAKTALRVAKMAPVLAAVRRGMLTISEAASMLSSSRTYVSHLINQTDEVLIETNVSTI